MIESRNLSRGKMTPRENRLIANSHLIPTAHWVGTANLKHAQKAEKSTERALFTTEP